MQTLIEVEIADNMPGSQWTVHKDPRLLFAVVYTIEREMKADCVGISESTDNNFTAQKKQNGEIILALPNGSVYDKRLLYVIMKNVEAMAKVLTELEWGAKFMADMRTQAQKQKEIIVPGMEGKIRL